MLKRSLSGSMLAALLVAVISATSAAGAGLAPRISDERGIKVTVIPQDMSKAAQSWDFEVTLETHTRDLGDDMAKSAMLVADGKQYQPLGWKGAPPGGHHRKGVLRFKAIAPQPASVELRMRLTGEADPRNFQWSLQGGSNGK